MKKILFLCVVTALAAGCGKEKPKEAVVNAVPTVANQLPALQVTLTDDDQVFFKDLKGKVLIVFFNPDCDHCQREAKMISEHKDVFSSYQVYFVTPDQMPAIQKFAVDYNLIEPNFHFGRAEGADVFNAVGAINQVPTFMVYNDQLLVGRNEGELTIDQIRAILK